jgi:hypothetical protein
MSCCGQNRSNFTARPPALRPIAAANVRPARVPSLAPAVQSGGMVALRSVSTGGMVVRGPATGRQYSFSAATPVQMVEVRDAAALLRTSWFQRT